MRKLNRVACPTPPCLGRYHHGVDTWDNVSSTHKVEIRTHLEMMQGKRCAYCEGNIETLGQHIEHFRRKSVYPTLTFDWNNLYFSCNQKNSCGRFKDHGAGPYDIADLIDPCLDDPDNFFVFRSDGTISVRGDASASNGHRARETLRVFALDAEWGRLRAMRKAAVAGYIKYADEAHNVGFSPDDIRAYFADELTCARNDPFYTAIRHVLTERQ
jgi:uncharacterized protein (TIGR02646 family)